MTEPNWNRQDWATGYTEPEVAGARTAFAKALACPVFSQWYARVAGQVTKTTPGGSVSGDVQDNLFILYFDPAGNWDALRAATELGWRLAEEILSRKVYKGDRSAV